LNLLDMRVGAILLLLTSPVGSLIVSPSSRSPRCALSASTARRYHPTMAVPPTEESSLSELRAFVKENELDVKTAGAGRTKAVILADILSVLGASDAGVADAGVAVAEAASVEVPEAAEAKVAAKKTAADKKAAEAAAQAASEAEAVAAAQAAFEAEAAAAAQAEAEAKAAVEAKAAADAQAAVEAETAAAAQAEVEAAAEEERIASMGSAPSGFEWGGIF